VTNIPSKPFKKKKIAMVAADAQFFSMFWMHFSFSGTAPSGAAWVGPG